MGKQNKDMNPISGIFSSQIHFNHIYIYQYNKPDFMHMYLCNSILHCGFQKIRCLFFNTAHTALNKPEIHSKVSQFCLGEKIGKTTRRKRTGISEFIIGTKYTYLFFTWFIDKLIISSYI